MLSPTIQHQQFRLAVLRLIALGLAVGFTIAAIWTPFTPVWITGVAAVSAVVCATFAATLPALRKVSDWLVRAFLMLIMGAVFFLGLTIQPPALGTLTGFVLVGIAVGIASYEEFRVAVALSLASVGFGVVAILVRSAVPAPATGVFLGVAAVSLFAVFGFRRVAAAATGAAIAESLKDPLTGMTNRRGLDLGASLLSAIAERSGQRLGCLILDLDDFKLINDGYGHEVGDQVLVAVSRRLQSVARQGDLFVRLGGDEFALFTVVNNTTELTAIGERLRAAVEQLDSTPRVTASVGGALRTTDGPTTLDPLMRLADGQLYMAKSAGKNRTLVPAS